jgi:hypothetical protein
MSKESMKLALEPQQEPMRECNPIDCQYIDGLGKTDCDWCRPKKSTLPAAPVHQTCNCRWDGEVQVQQCTLHQAHVDAIHEWAERAKAAEAKLAAQPAPVQEPVAMRMPTVGDRVVCIDDESLGTVVYLTAGGSPEIKFDDGSHGTYMLREFAELFGYTHPSPAAAVKPTKDVEISNMGKPFTVKAYVTPTAAQPAPVPLTDEQAKQLLKDSDLLEMFENIGWYSAPLKGFNQKGLALIRAIETAHGITKGQP